KEVASNAGIKTMNRIRDLVDEMRAAEHRLLKQRDEEAKDNVALTRWTIALATGIALFAVSALAFLIIRSIANPVRFAINQLSTASAEILASTTQQTSGAQEQAAAIAQTLSTVTEVAQTAEQSAQRARGVGDAVQ